MHVRIPRISLTAAALGIPYKRAVVPVVGAQHGRNQKPEYDGVIIHASSYNDLMTGVNNRNIETARKATNLNAANAKRDAHDKEYSERLMERQKMLAGDYSTALFEQKLATSGLSDVRSAVGAVRLAVGKAASEMDTSPAAVAVVDEAIAKVSGRLNALRAQAALLDLHTLPRHVDLIAVLDGSRPPASVLAQLCCVVADVEKVVHWHIALASLCTPVVLQRREVIQTLKKEIAANKSAFHIDEALGAIWLEGAIDNDIARRIATFDATLERRGVSGAISPALERERQYIAGGRDAVERRIRDELEKLTRDQVRERARDAGTGLFGARRRGDIIQHVVDAEMAVDDPEEWLKTVLASKLMSDEVAANAEITDLLGRFRHSDLRQSVIQQWHASLAAPLKKTVRAIALSAIANARAAAFDALSTDVVAVTWNKREVRSTIAKAQHDLFADSSRLVVDGREPDAIVREAAKRANKEIAKWKVDHKRAVAECWRRKDKLDRLLAARGFVREPHYLYVFTNSYRLVEIDVSLQTVVEHTGLVRPPPIGVSMMGSAFCLANAGDKMVSTYSPGTPAAIASFETAVNDSGFWRALTLQSDYSECAVLRWPLRLCLADAHALNRVVDDLKAPIRVPVELDVRVARRASLLAAVRANGYIHRRLPLCVTAGPILAFLCNVQWPVSRATAAARVGDVESSMQCDIFGALPQLVLALICDFMFAARDTVGFESLAKASDAFALGASIWVIGHIEESGKLDAAYYSFCPLKK
jgi:hypothetical protein